MGHIAGNYGLVMCVVNKDCELTEINWLSDRSGTTL